MTRRQALRHFANGFGMLGLAGLLAGRVSADAIANALPSKSPLIVKPPPFAARAKRIIFLFMAGGPSHVDTFDPKPRLNAEDGKPLPFEPPKLMRTKPGKIFGSPFNFHKHGQSGIEDLALMCAIPNLTVIDPCDATEIQQATEAIANFDGPVYMRLLRGIVPVVLNPESYQFQLGRAALLREGTDVGIISTGLMTERALDASVALAAQGIDAGVLHVPTLKPLDVDAICDFASSVNFVLTAENHVVTCGLGTLVADALMARRIGKTLVKLGIPDQFVECGSVPHLQEKYGLLDEHIVAKVKAELQIASTTA